MKEKILGWIAFGWAAITGAWSWFYDLPVSDINRTAMLISILAAVFTAYINYWYRKRRLKMLEEQLKKRGYE